MDKRYISIHAKNAEESIAYQQALFNKGFHWVVSGFEFQKHKKFYARFEDLTLITCYHDPSIEEESVKLSIDEIKKI